MAVRNAETAEDYYGNEIRVGDTIACISDGIKLALVMGIQERTLKNYRDEDYILSELMIRLVKADGEFAEYVSKQKNSASTVLVTVGNDGKDS